MSDFWTQVLTSTSNQWWTAIGDYTGGTYIFTQLASQDVYSTNSSATHVANASATHTHTDSSQTTYSNWTLSIYKQGSSIVAKGQEDVTAQTDVFNSHYSSAKIGSTSFYKWILSSIDTQGSSSSTSSSFLSNTYSVPAPVASVPGPIAGAGLPALLGLMGFAAWRRKQTA
jgi:hypothetical protein